MKISKIPGLGRFGVFIDDVDLQEISDDEWTEIGKIHLESLVTIIRNTNLDSDRYLDLIRKWGETRYSYDATLLKKYNEPNLTPLAKRALNNDHTIENKDIEYFKMVQRIILNNDSSILKVSGQKDADGNPLGLFAEGELLWHSNESGCLTHVPGVSLLAVENVIGSATGFVTTTDWYESQTESFRSELDEMICLHEFTPGKITPGLNEKQDYLMYRNMCPVNGTEIPLIIQSPGGIRGLHYSVNTISTIKGMSKKESEKIFSIINKGIFTENNIYDHWYQSNSDLCLFDNTITLHRRLGDIKQRLCYRCQFDYTNLQTEPYVPYLQQPYISRYIQDITDIVKTVGIKNFKLPELQ
jgi:alpha-ketoglutarate-dependent taurine dioxygenase